jgi:DnaA family protein
MRNRARFASRRILPETYDDHSAAPLACERLPGSCGGRRAVSEQLAFDLAAAGPPTFDNFVPGRNGFVVAQLRAVAEGAAREPMVLLWGPDGAGRSHLLRATVAASTRAGAWFAAPGDLPEELPADLALVAVDDVGGADAAAQGRLFTLFNRLQAAGGTMLAAAHAPPARLALRDDLRTRLGSGLVFEVVPLSDADKPAALARYASERGFTLSGEVIAYLLAHGRRDMGTLVAALAALDRASLAAKRPITVPLLRHWLAQPLDLGGGPDGRGSA